MAGWTSGWVNTDGATAVANGATLNFTHNLGSTDLILSIFLADDQAGTNSLFIGNNSEKGSSGTQAYDAQVNNLSPNSLTVQLGSGGYFNLTAAGQTDTGTSISFATKFIKVVAIAAISDPVPGAGDLCKILSEDSGYQMFRNGLTIQWMSSAAFTAQDQPQSVNFPIAFAAKPFKVVSSTRNPDGAGNSGAIIIETTNWTNTSVTLMSQAEGDTPRPNRPYFADIIAIGIAEVTDCPGSTDPNDPSDPEGTKISQLTSAAELKDDDLFVISKENTGDGIYDISQKITLSQLATYIAGAEPPTPTPPTQGIVHFSSKIISNASSSTESKAFEDDAFSDITAAGVYEIQSTYAFEYYKLATHQGPYPYTRLDPNRAGDGWNSSSGLGKAAPTVAKQDLKSMAIPAGTTVKFSLDWTHLGATYVHHQYTREDLIFFEITGPALIVDLSPGETLPDASAGTHLADMGITSEKVYNWYNILPYPDTDGSPNRSYATIFDKGTFSEQRTDTGTASQAASINSLYFNVGTQWNSLVSQELFFRDFTRATIDSLFKLPATTANGVAIDQRTLRNMPYTSTLIIE